MINFTSYLVNVYVLIDMRCCLYYLKSNQNNLAWNELMLYTL